MRGARSNMSFAIPYMVFTITYFLFGTPVHMKHIFYYYLGWFFVLPEFPAYFTYTNLILSMVMFAQSCRLDSDKVLAFHGVVYCFVSYIFEENLVAEEAGGILVSKKEEEANTRGIRIWQIFRGCRKLMTILCLLLVLTLYATYMVATQLYKFDSIGENRYVEDTAFRTVFVLLLVTFGYSWTCINIL